MADYYDWNKTLSFDADVTMVVGERGVGKTYGLRLQLIRDHIAHGWNFVEVVRHKTEIAGVASTYFDKMTRNDEFPDKVFKTDNSMAFMADKPDGDEKPKWELCGYFCAMSMYQQLKKRTFDNVKRILLDEAILDKKDRYHNYLPHEFEILAGLIDTFSRERPDTDCIVPRLYLLGNALDVMNPYFVHYNVGVPRRGFSWHGGKTMLLHYAEHADYAREKAANTVAGRMLANTIDGSMNVMNQFDGINSDFVMRKTKVAKFAFGIVYSGTRFGIWADWNNGYYFVTSDIPNNADKPIYTLTLDDNRFNYVAARKADSVLATFSDMHYAGCIRYESIAIRERFKEVLALFGVR